MQIELLRLLLPLLAQALNCSSPPTTGWGKEGYSAYASWCSACGGTPYNNNGVGCNRGPNWGGKGSGGSAPVGGFSNQQQLQLQMMQGMVNAFGQLQAEEEARRQQREAIEAEERRQAAERHRIMMEARHHSLKGNLKGVEGTGKLAIKRDDDTYGKPQLLLRKDESQPIPEQVDCVKTQETRERLAKGLDVQREGIKRADQLFKEADTDRSMGRLKLAKELAFGSLGTMNAVAKAVPLHLTATDKVLEKLKLSGKLDAKKLASWAKRSKKVRESSEAVTKLYDSGEAGWDYGKKLSKGSHGFVGHLNAANEFFYESGLKGEVVEYSIENIGRGLSSAGGAFGVILFESGSAAIDISHAYGEQRVAGKIADDAYRTYAILKNQLDKSERRLEDLDEKLGAHCR